MKDFAKRGGALEFRGSDSNSQTRQRKDIKVASKATMERGRPSYGNVREDRAAFTWSGCGTFGVAGVERQQGNAANDLGVIGFVEGRVEGLQQG
jgi:hypothetical protein